VLSRKRAISPNISIPFIRDGAALVAARFDTGVANSLSLE
jgi:hypothetical protein